MASYDPQRNRPRQRPKDDEPAPVDALLGDGADAAVDPSPAEDDNPVTAPDPLSTADRLAVPATAAPPAAPPEVHADDLPLAHVHGDDCDHGPDPAMGIAVVVLSTFGAVLLVWNWLRRRRRGDA
jgi:hypothetical protein